MIVAGGRVFASQADYDAFLKAEKEAAIERKRLERLDHEARKHARLVESARFDKAGWKSEEK